jgi:hypothetical protein
LRSYSEFSFSDVRLKSGATAARAFPGGQAGRKEELTYGWGEYPASPSPSWRGPGESQGLFHLGTIIGVNYGN